MGTGPTVHLASVRQPRAIILMSAYTSIKNVVQDKLKFLSVLVAKHFNNIDKIERVTAKTAVLLLHGKKDSLIPYQHSVDLFEKLNMTVSADLVLSEKMSHNEFDFFSDLIRPVYNFMFKLTFDPNPTQYKK